ncbi:hypothetical protein [Williamsia sp.]|uniref:hypothetical protein n=1 Tax=Williamsia sp. TaxID=1872085 RepID=UPI002F9278BB
MITAYADPNTDEPQSFNFDVGLRSHPGAGGVINWRPTGSYVDAGATWTHGLEPGKIAFELKWDDPVGDIITPTSVKKTCFHLRMGRGPDGSMGYNGIPWTGRIVDAEWSGTPGREKKVYYAECNKIWLQSMYGWVNNLFPPELQVNITGKHDVRIGSPDRVMKSYVTSVATRLGIPFYSALPMRQPSAWENLRIDDFDSLDDVFEFLSDVFEPIMFSQARFTQLDELFAQDVQRLDWGIKVDLWDGRGTSPTVFNTDTLADLQSIINTTDDDFLNLSKLASIGGGLWSNQMDRAGYVFETYEKRDNRKCQFRTDADSQITSYTSKGTHSRATRAIVGGKSPAILNDIIEIGANLAIQLLLNLIAPGLGLGAVVGDLFDDIFFAYQVFWDSDLEAEIGKDDALPEKFADNTAAYSLDAYATGKNELKAKGGEQSITINAMSGVPGRGNSFGEDDGTSRRYKIGDRVHLWDRGNFVEQYVSSVTVTDKPGERRREMPTLGNNKRLKGPWSRLIGGVQGLSANSRGQANAI